jgi:hypothetical protein
MAQFLPFKDVELELFYDAKVPIDVGSLQSILPKGTEIPQGIDRCTCMCWTNVLLILGRLFDRKISRSIALVVFSRIRKANSTMKSPTQMPELVDALNLPITLVEYSLDLATGTGVGWSFGPANGKKKIFLCNIGTHYQIFVPPGTTLASLGMSAPPASYKLFPTAHKIIEGISLSKSMLDEVKAINDAHALESKSMLDEVKAINDAHELAHTRRLKVRRQQELYDAALARRQQELYDAALARRQQELDDAALARQLAGLFTYA